MPDGLDFERPLLDLENRIAHVEAGVRNVQLSEAVAAVAGGAAYHFAPDPSSRPVRSPTVLVQPARPPA